MQVGFDTVNGGPVYLSNCTSTAMGKLGGLCPVAYKMSRTFPVAPLHKPFGAHRLDLSITLAPLARSSTGSRPPASSVFADAALEQECTALMRAIGVPREFSFCALNCATLSLL